MCAERQERELQHEVQRICASQCGTGAIIDVDAVLDRIKFGDARGG